MSKQKNVPLDLGTTLPLFHDEMIIWKREVSQRFFVTVVNCHLSKSLFENFSVLQRMIVYG